MYVHKYLVCVCACVCVGVCVCVGCVCVGVVRVSRCSDTDSYGARCAQAQEARAHVSASERSLRSYSQHRRVALATETCCIMVHSQHRRDALAAQNRRVALAAVVWRLISCRSAACCASHRLAEALVEERADHECTEDAEAGGFSCIRQHTSAYVSRLQHTSAYVSIRQHTSAYVSIRQHTSAGEERGRGGRRLELEEAQLREYLDFSTSKASKLSTSFADATADVGEAPRARTERWLPAAKALSSSTCSGGGACRNIYNIYFITYIYI
jgi:hypothetical protein